MRRLTPLALAAAALALPATAPAHDWQEGACGLPGSRPLYVEYAEVGVSPAIRAGIFTAIRPPLVLATSGPVVPDELRAAGAHTVFWDMNLHRSVGRSRAPAEPAAVAGAADRLAARAVAESGCATPLVVLNELEGAWLPTPWSERNAAYRANVLALVERLHELGARPLLLVGATRPVFTGSSEAAEWWRRLARSADIVLQVHFNGRAVLARGPLLAGRTRRQAMRRALERLDAVGVPPERLGLLHGFQARPGFGGREGLPLAEWLRVVKWEALAAAHVTAERAAEGRPLGSVLSWGWGDFPKGARPDPDKPLVACTYLWVRDPALCDAPARAAARRVPFSTSRTAGQILLAPDVRCRIGAPRRAIGAAAVERLAAVSGEAPLGSVPPRTALTALFARTVLWGRRPVHRDAVLAAERQLVAARFGGSTETYAAALAARGADLEIARGVLLDQLLRRRLPSRARRAALSRALATATCVRDELPAPVAPDLTAWLPFLRL